MLSQVLSIGWGHSEIAVELSRTQAGTHALLLIGALSVGYSYFAAAQVLSELLVLLGCEADQLPSVDVLRPLVAYLAPFMRDLGFSRVLHLVTTSAEHVAMRKLNHCPVSLTAAGEPPILAGAVTQLMLTSRLGETVYMNTGQRGAWLAAFASHILGMSVSLILGDTVLWACAGTSGEAVIQVGQPEDRQDSRGGAGVGAGTSLQRHANTTAPTNIVLVDPPRTADGEQPLVLDCTLAEALDASLGHYPLVDETIRHNIHCAIADLSRDITKWLSLEAGDGFRSHKIGGDFDSAGALTETLSHFGIPGDVVGRALDRVGSVRHTRWPEGEGITDHHGLKYMDTEAIRYLQQTCPTHQADPDANFFSGCLCSKIGRLIHSYASSVAALMQCRYDPETTRVQAALLEGRVGSSWVEGCILPDDLIPVLNFGHGSILSLFSHLSHLLHSGDSDAPSENKIASLRYNVLGISGGSTTIHFSLILTDDCYDAQGRLITISSGRATVNGLMRHLLLETKGQAPVAGAFSDLPRPKTSEVAVGTYVQPHYRPGNLRIFLDAIVTEGEIRVSAALGDDITRARPICLFRLIDNLFFTTINRPCSHSHDEPWKIPGAPLCVRLSPLAAQQNRDANQLILYALKGRKLEQMVQCYIDDTAALQLSMCLGCASDLVGHIMDYRPFFDPLSNRFCKAIVMT